MAQIILSNDQAEVLKKATGPVEVRDEQGHFLGYARLRNPEMHERFTDRARKVIQLANQEAMRFNHEYIGTEHILLGLVKVGAGRAATVLKNLNVDPRKIRIEVEKRVPSICQQVDVMELPPTPRMKRVIEYALDECRQLNQGSVGTECILLGLLREEGCVAAQVLVDLGLNLENVRDEVRRLADTEQE